MSSSVVAAYVDKTLVAYEAKKVFDEAAEGHLKQHEVDFFEQKGSLKCLAKMITRRIYKKPTINSLKKADIRREVENFLRYLEGVGMLQKPKVGPNHGKWVFCPSRLSALEVIGSKNTPIAHDQSAPPAESITRAKRKSGPSRTRSGDTERTLSYINDSQRHRLRHA